ncbi:MAG: hypothetical protein HQ522_09835 [Bacteroidetes bacterium]|nr:hypothetical protein [Bacteroidota bacterium]
MELIRKNTKLLFILVLPVYSYIIQSSILNKHTHFYANGLVITHSHTFDLEGDKRANNHQHSQTEICLFCALNINLHEVASENSFDFSIDYKAGYYVVADVQIEYTSPNFQISPRDPPFLIVLKNVN